MSSSNEKHTDKSVNDKPVNQSLVNPSKDSANQQTKQQSNEPKNYNPKIAEPKWQKYWEDNKIFAFDPNDSIREIYSVDTPPPTVSGKMHIGHAFSYAQQDFIVRYQRMIGKNVFYPFGTDDNGLPTERLIEKTKNVRAKDMDRPAFVKLCLETLDKELRPQYIADWKRIGMSCDWNIFYTTINPHCQRISQQSFIELYKKGREYRKDAPTMWCPECQTGISQVECQDKELDSMFNDIVFKVADDNGKITNLIVATTRPELLPACVAIFYHPEDGRYKKFDGKKAKVPLFDIHVQIMADERANPEKGTGIVMCCTFGDQTDMEWQKAHNLGIRMAITEDGRMTELAGKYKGLKIKEARKAIIADLKEEGLLVNQKPIKHAVNVHERCGTEVEYIKSKQWFIKYLDLKDEMFKWGEELNWYPDYMRVRYEHWVKGLQWDWLISRQRYFGIPFPVWYCAKCDEVILAKEENLPVDPLVDKAPVSKCPKCGNNSFKPETDVLDTWATSSLTPQITTEMFKDKPIYKRLNPMSLRPQAHDIITFWLFNTVVKSQLHKKMNPWIDVVISGHAQDAHGKKMSKSKGNIVEPQIIIDKFSADALRFWAAGSKLGDDLPFQEKDIVTGMKFTTKLWNASKFALMHLEDFNANQEPCIADLEYFDRWLLSKLNRLVKESTETFMKYEYAKTKFDVEQFFWKTLCDNYLEIAKDRLYNPQTRGKEARFSAQYALYNALLANLKLIAPIMPHITEEIYHMYFNKKDGKKSIHISQWPKYYEKFIDEEVEKAGDAAVEVIAAVRKFKSEQQISLKEEISSLVIECPADLKNKFDLMMDDIKATARAKKVEFGKANIQLNETLKITIVG
ncbi:MAG: valine--tRNA ligase [Nanoarchaeota archaeon]|nr:valine--tRNA ligase [Nanoarchaeota archaeon]